MIPLILLIQSNQVTSKEKHTMERQVTKDASGSKGESKKEAEPWRCEENRLRYERNKQELRLTEAEREKNWALIWRNSYGLMMMIHHTKIIELRFKRPLKNCSQSLGRNIRDWMQRLLSPILNLSRVSFLM
ncbi:hypothetical protein QL285_093144 [Trifolium repens]|nr:hypothetical protein QL285_093144 [Trifolium repens]